MSDTPHSRNRYLIAVVIFFLMVYALFSTAQDTGFTGDEGIYFVDAVHLWAWFHDGANPSRFDAKVLRSVWAPRLDHPPLGRLAIMVAVGELQESIGLIWAARMAPVVCFALAAMLLFLYMDRRFGRAAGVLSVLFMGLMPQLFAHARLATLEMPQVLVWVMTAIAFEKGMRSRTWSVITGFCFGLALLTKFNAVFLPIILIPWGVLFYGARVIPNVIAMAFLGPLTFIAGWPALWNDTWQTLTAYVQDKFHRAAIPVYYLGHAYLDPPAPWHYPFVLTLVTTPVVILAAAVAGILRIPPGFSNDNAAPAVKKGDKPAVPAISPRRSAFLLLFMFAGTVCCASFPGAPHYDGVRLFLPAFPFLACLAGLGAAYVWERGSRMKRPSMARGVLVALLVLQTVPLILFHPFQIGYYNELVGGPWGAKKLGFETTYWGEGFTRHVVDYLVQQLPNGGKVALVAIDDYAQKVYGLEIEKRGDRVEPLWPKNIDTVDFARDDWDYAVIIPRQGWLLTKLSKDEKAKLAELRRHPPDFAEYLSRWHHLSVCEVYRKPAANSAGSSP